MASLVLIRHGESVWNRADIFTGWTDVELTDHGMEQAAAAGRWLTEAGHRFDACHTSYQKRAIKTLWIVLETMDQMWLPIQNSWRLNERHYGALQGQSKQETAERFGSDQVFTWRRSYEVRPPALEPSDPRFPGHDPRYRDLQPSELPLTESLADTVARVLPYWNAAVAPQLRRGLDVLIAAHGNSLRALVKHLDGISDADIPSLEIATGAPLVYRFDDSLRVIDRQTSPAHLQKTG